MNRPIKFRAWNGESMEYGGFAIHASGCIDNISPLSNVTENSSIMQYTGLKDKNGQEIYEGDILRLVYTSHGERVEKIITVQWDINMWTIPRITWVQHEIIGNIHQNPELLERKEAEHE